jgi:thiosulfate dehydrogenase [quinone] large subunit
MINNTISFLILRLAIGASMFGHGLVRLPKLDKFSGWMVKSFENSMLPAALVKPFSYALPIAEFLVGLLLIIGLFTRQSLVAGSIVMIMLIFGTTLIENWEALVSQLVHAAFFALLLSYITYNGYSLDNPFKK